MSQRGSCCDLCQNVHWPMFRSKSFMVSGFTFKSITHFEFIFVYDVRKCSSFIVLHVQFSSVAQSCPALCDPMDCHTPGLPVHHQLLEFIQTYVHWTTSSSVIPFSSCRQSFPASGYFPMSQFFESGGQSIGVSASTSILPMNIQYWFPLGWTG